MAENATPTLISRALERNVIACMLTSADSLEAVNLPVAAFETEYLRVPYSVILDLRSNGQEVNVSTLRTFFDQRDDFAAIIAEHGGYQFLENLAAKPDFTNFKLHVAELQKRHTIRETKARAGQAMDAIQAADISDPKEILDIVDTHLAGEDFVTDNEVMKTDELNKDWLEEQTALFLAGGFKQCGIPVLNDHLQRVMGEQVLHGSMVTLAGETNVGKSQWIQMLVRHFTYHQGIPTLVLDNELSKREFRNRTLANLSGVRLKNIINGSAFNPASIDYSEIRRAVEIMERTPLMWRQLMDMDIEKLEPIVRRFLRQYPKDRYPHKIISIDGIKMATGNDSYIEVGFFAQRLKGLAQKYEPEGVALFPTCQLNRTGTARQTAKDKDLHPDHTNIGLSKIIADISDDVILMLKHPEVDGSGQKIYSKHHRRLINTKARNHATFDGLNYILMDFDGSRSYLEPSQSVGPEIEQQMPSVDPSQDPDY